jgi:hypothetical protein
MRFWPAAAPADSRLEHAEGCELFFADRAPVEMRRDHEHCRDVALAVDVALDHGEHLGARGLGGEHGIDREHESPNPAIRKRIPVVP